MFERYTQAARRTIFGARYIASQVGSLQIETEHLLLGVLTTDKTLASRFLGSPWAAETVWKLVDRESRFVKESQARGRFHSTRHRNVCWSWRQKKQTRFQVNRLAPSTCCLVFFGKRTALVHKCCLSLVSVSLPHAQSFHECHMMIPNSRIL